ncbi:hypothetical protein KXV98_005363, partial [Aspergillus fumigatus]
QEQLRKRRNNLIRRVNDFWQLYSIRSWLILEMPNGRLYTYQSHPGLPAPTTAEMREWPQPVVHRTPADFDPYPTTVNVVVPPPPTFNIRGRQTKAWDYLFGLCGLPGMGKNDCSIGRNPGPIF